MCECVCEGQTWLSNSKSPGQENHHRHRQADRKPPHTWDILVWREKSYELPTRPKATRIVTHIHVHVAEREENVWEKSGVTFPRGITYWLLFSPAENPHEEKSGNWAEWRISLAPSLSHIACLFNIHMLFLFPYFLQGKCLINMIYTQQHTNIHIIACTNLIYIKSVVYIFVFLLQLIKPPKISPTLKSPPPDWASWEGVSGILECSINKTANRRQTLAAKNKRICVSEPRRTTLLHSLSVQSSMSIIWRTKSRLKIKLKINSFGRAAFCLWLRHCQKKVVGNGRILKIK